MLQRCQNPNNPKFKDYGGRGITVHKRWKGEGGFMNFLADMGPKPSPKHSIGRRINDFPYSRLNARWETATEQARNKRSNKLSIGKADGIRFLYLFGFTQEEIARKFNVDQTMISLVVTRKTWKLAPPLE